MTFISTEKQQIHNDKPLREKYVANASQENASQEQWGPVTVPPNSYLVLGNSRQNSYDGRYWGFVPRNSIIGKAAVRYWPFNRVGELEQKPTLGTSK